VSIEGKPLMNAEESGAPFMEGDDSPRSPPPPRPTLSELAS